METEKLFAVQTAVKLPLTAKLYFVYNYFMTKNFTPLDPKKLAGQAVSSIASLFKEAEPTNLEPEKIEIQESREQEPDEEVKQYVQVKSETIQLPPDLKQLGLHATPTTNFPTTQVTLPVSDDKIVEGLHQPVTSSWRWLAVLMVYILKQAHITLKKVHGQITRVVSW